jgi:hypothetical protein
MNVDPALGQPDLLLAIDKCAFCHDQCMAATPELLATKDQSMVVSRVATQLRLISHGLREWAPEIAERTYLGLNDGIQYEDCLFHDEGHRIEPYLRSARRAALQSGVAPGSVRAISELLDLAGNVFGLVEELAAPQVLDHEAPILVHDAAMRYLDPTALHAARLLLERVSGPYSELAIASCGAVEADLGFDDRARHAAELVTARLREMGPGPVVTPDPTLAFTLSALYPAWGLKIGRPVFHLAHYLAGRLPLPLAMLRGGVTVVYHDPGSLARGLDIVDEPRTLLRGIGGVTLVEAIPGGRRASSDGPLAGYPRPDIATAIASIRLQELLATGADCIATASPYSLRNLRSVAHGVPVMDVLSIAATACGAIETPPEWEMIMRRTGGGGGASRGLTERAVGDPCVHTADVM